MLDRRYTEEFKKVAVQKYFSKGNRSLLDLCKEIGISRSSLRIWVQQYKKYANNSGMKDIPKRPQDWTAAEKIRALFEYENLSLEKQGEFLRSNGLHSSHVLEWKKLCISSLSSKVNNTEVIEANRKIKELERDLSRKDKALSETAALLVLKKKADLIWGIEDPK
jgi:transposase